MSVVVDASVALAIVLGEGHADEMKARLETLVRSGTPMLVPSHFWLEVVNVLGARHRWSGAAILAALHHLDAFGFTTVDIDRPHLMLAVSAMERHGLSAYDAQYLALASGDGIGLLTLDRPLREAAGSSGIPVDRARGAHEGSAGYDSDRAGSPTWPHYRELSAFISKLRADAMRDRETIRR